MTEQQIDYEKEMVGTVEVEDRDKLDMDALTAWFEANVEGYEGPISYSKFKGGQSNPTYRIDTPGTSYVLRRQPFGKLLPSAHAVDREYRAMTGLYPTGFPVPRTYGLCEDPGCYRFEVLRDEHGGWSQSVERRAARQHAGEAARDLFRHDRYDG